MKNHTERRRWRCPPRACRLFPDRRTALTWLVYYFRRCPVLEFQVDEEEFPLLMHQQVQQHLTRLAWLSHQAPQPTSFWHY